MTLDALRALAETVDPADGFRVDDVVLGEMHMVYLGYYVAGAAVPRPWWPVEPTNIYLLWRCHRPTEEQLGVKQRVIMLAEALCRFKNTGGTPEEAEAVMSFFGGVLAAAPTPLFPGVVYLHTLVRSSDCALEHTFGTPGCAPVLRWVERLAVRAEMRLLEEGAGDDGAGGCEAGGGAAHPVRQLPADTGAGDA